MQIYEKNNRTQSYTIYIQMQIYEKNNRTQSYGTEWKLTYDYHQKIIRPDETPSRMKQKILYMKDEND